MKKTLWIIFLGVFPALIPTSFISAKAQLLEREKVPHVLIQKENISSTKQTTLTEGETQNQPTPTPEDFRIGPRFTINHNSSGGGFDGFTGVEGFAPLNQTPGSEVTYLNGRINLDNDANLGGNLILGHRFIDTIDGRLYGGYLAWDSRDTGTEVFHQLGVGVESLGNTWDWRVNSYLPVGNRRRSTSTSGTQITGTNFANNTLVLDVIDILDVQTALGGIEAETGIKIADFGNGGDLRGFGGLYYLDGPDRNSVIGGRFRLQAQPTESLSMGAGVQFDDIFGTNVLFQIGFSLPSSAEGSRETDVTSDSLYRRVADPIARNNAIVVERQRLGGGAQTAIVAIDPLTGAAYTIQHVDPITGTVTGTGTVEAPVDTIANAIPLASSGDIVYVQAGNAGGGFTIPDGVQVLSVGPTQTVTTQFGDVQLPGSGSGTRPTINNGNIILGNNTTISGLEITNAPGNAISGTDTDNVTIQDNRVDGALGAGIALDNVGGDVIIINNQLDNSRFDTGIFVTTGDSAQQLTITGNRINGNARHGILVRATNNAQVVADIQNNQLTGNNIIGDPTETGIEVEASNTAPGLLCLQIEDNSSDTNAELTIFPGSQFAIVNQATVDANNVGTVSLVDLSGTTSFTDVSSCTP